MNRDDDFIERLEDYLDTFDGVVPLPMHVRTEVQARLPMTRQVRGRGSTVGIPRASTTARWVIGVAAVLAVMFIGTMAFDLGGTLPGVGTDPTPTVSATPSPSPSPGEPTPLADAPTVSCGPGLLDGCVAPGTYRLSGDAWPATVSLTLPGRWFRFVEGSDFEGVLVETEDGASGWGVVFMEVGEVSLDPCDPTAGVFSPEETTSVDALVAAISSWSGFEVSAPTPVEVGGFAGQLVEVTSTRSGSDCPAGVVWSTPDGTLVDTYPMVGVASEPRPGQFRIVDVGAGLLVIRTTDFADTSPFELEQGIDPDADRHAAHQVELREILDSVRIDS